MANAGRLAVAIDGTGGTFPSPREVAEWLVALEVRQWVPGRCPAAPSASSISAAATGARVLALRHVFHPSSGGANESGLDAAPSLVDAALPAEAVVASLVRTVSHAAAVRAEWVIVELGRSPEGGDAGLRARANASRLDRACRILHVPLRQFPEIGIALLTPAQADDFGRPDELDAIFEDLGARRRLAYWHDAGRARVLAARSIVTEVDWLSRHGARCAGVDACDASGTISGLPAGSGEIDFVELRSAVGAQVPFVARVDPFAGPAPLLGAVRFLRELGL